jgi:alkylation response protein AidB-like acyl-CoA dehydrogenase
MKFDLSEDQQLLRDSTRDFFAKEAPIERARRIMEHEPRGFDAAAWARLAEMGYLGLHLPASAGGQGLGAVELAIVLEEIGRACFPGPYLDVALAAALLAAAEPASPLLKEIAAGEAIVTIAREDAPYAGAHEPAARFERGRVRGSKHFVPFAAEAKALLVTTPQGVALAEGPFETTPLTTFDLGSRFARVDLDGTAELLKLSPEALARHDDLTATAAAAVLLGLMSRAFEITLDYVKTRQAFGRPIGTFQALQHRLAEQLLKIESTRSAVYRAAWCLDDDPGEAPLAAASAKVYAGEASRVVCGESIQMHGGIGFTWELDLHFFFKRAKTLESLYGSTEAELDRALAAAGL